GGGDGGFVGLMLGATFLLVLGIRYMHVYVLQQAPLFFERKFGKEEAEQKTDRFVRETFSDKAMFLAGAPYGAAIASVAVFWLDPWPYHSVLAIMLWLFLFSANYVTGMGVVGLCMLFGSMWKSKDDLEVTVWRRSNASTRFIEGLRLRTAGLAAIYIGVSLGSIALSVLPFKGPMIWYAVFAVLIILAELIVPGLVIQTRLDKKRDEEMAAMECKLQSEFDALIKDQAGEIEETRLAKFDSLLTLKDRMDHLALPLLTWRSLRDGAVVLVMTALPIVLKYALQQS
ncbi:MAG: hypothetical protein L0I62_08515, partial [Gammaproteobacteria bacterium]|nr:hypothetical protein [Gammaproteobacteria bacterium]